MDLSIIIPCFNEQASVELLAAGLQPVVDDLRSDRTVELVFVDDGSTDGQPRSSGRRSRMHESFSTAPIVDSVPRCAPASRTRAEMSSCAVTATPPMRTT